jgi:hypothetical protein
VVADAILDCSARANIVLDPFLGSGTTVIAAERTGRRRCGLELDPLLVGAHCGGRSTVGEQIELALLDTVLLAPARKPVRRRAIWSGSFSTI